MDLSPNAAFYETIINGQGSHSKYYALTNGAYSVAGALKTETGLGLEEANVILEGTPPNAMPLVTTFKLSDTAGLYMFADMLPAASSYTVTPIKDDNPLNGVTTYDLTLISKHILGITPLNSPYKMIAADINKSGSITASDMSELRKLILGIYQEFPSNNSWRFVDRYFTFPDSTNPFQTLFPEHRSLSNIQANMLTEDFVAIKVGDLSGNALANGLQQTEDRSGGTFYFEVNALSNRPDSIRAGEEVEVYFKATEKSAAYQFTLDFPFLEVQQVVPGAHMTRQNFGLFAADHLLTVSAEGPAGDFTLKFRAMRSGELSNMLHCSSRITKAEAYTERGEPMDIALRFHTPPAPAGVGDDFDLLQNQPNPLREFTAIAFHLPTATEATLTISNPEGRILKVIKSNYAKGLNSVQISRSDLEPGVLFYRLQTPTHSASRKMVVVK